MFTDDVIVLDRTVPDQGVGEPRVVDLARRYRLTTATIVDDLTVDPDTPSDGGIHVVEHNSVHFTGDTDVITADHAQQLDRLVELMNAFPGCTVHVVGNTDQSRRRDTQLRRLTAPCRSRRRLPRGPGHRPRRRRRNRRASRTRSPPTQPAADALNRRTDYVVFGLLGDGRPRPARGERDQRLSGRWVGSSTVSMTAPWRSES